jgi:CBS domain-containing protein
MLSGLPPGFDARAAEDTLCYRVPAAVARPLLDRARSRELNAGMEEPRHRPVGTLIRSPTVTCEPMTSVREVARRMTETGASAAVVDFGGRGFGIVTDRDIRTKVVAGGMPATTAAAGVMTTPAFSVTPDQLGGEVLFEMLERGIRHALVVSDRGKLIGVVGDSDLFAMQPRSWFGARRRIARAKDVATLAEITRAIPELVIELHASSLRAIEVARVQSALYDALTVRSLELASASFDLPADGIVWVAIGSQARRELTPGSTPRGAVVCTEPPPAGWLESVSSTFGRVGLHPEVELRSTERWIDAGDEELALAVLVERRALWGTPREPLPVVEGEALERVIAALARRALANPPPTGFDADAVIELDGTRLDQLDIRRAAVMPVVELARWAGAAAGQLEGSTIDRLRAAGVAGVLSEADARTLTDVFELALELRLAHHVERLASGAEPDDLLDPTEMSALTRGHLRDVFRSVAAVQRTLSG